MKIVVFANGIRGNLVCRRINHTDHKILSIVTPKANSHFFSNIKTESEIIEAKDINNDEFILRLEKLNPDIFLVAGFSIILSSKLLSIPKIASLNLHAGKLPKYRGGSPLNWQLINGEIKAGLSLIILDKGIDTGNILVQDEFTILDNDDIKDLHSKANSLFPELTLKALNKIKKGYRGVPQDESKALYWHQRNDNDGEINFKTLKAIEANRFIRALTHPYPGAWAYLGNKKIRFFRASITKERIKGVPGRIVFIQGKGPYIICLYYAILIEEYSIEGDSVVFLKNGQYTINQFKI